MIRKILFWLHLSAGLVTGLFIFIMAATGVVLAFERQIVDFVDRDIRSVTVPNEAKARSLNALLETVRREGFGEPSAISLRNQPEAATQFSIGRGKTAYIDPYTGAILGFSSPAVHEFFSRVERLHRSLGAPLGSKGVGHSLAAVSNLIFSLIILFGLLLWIPRKWSWTAIRASSLFRRGLGGKAREWNWHNVLGFWCAAPLLIIALSGVVMSYDWANTLLFRLSGSPRPASGRDGGERRRYNRTDLARQEPSYDALFTAAKTLDPNWRTITFNVPQRAHSPLSISIDTGAGGQPQRRAQYLLNGETGAILRKTSFADGSLGQRLRAFVRFGHTGEYGGLAGQAVAALASLAACVLVYTGFSLAVRRLLAWLKRRGQHRVSKQVSYAEQPVS